MKKLVTSASWSSHRFLVLTFILGLSALQLSSALAKAEDEPLPSEDNGMAEDSGAPKKRVDVKKLKKQYWSQDPSFDVVQNRTYSKASRIEGNVFGGLISSDPFLDVHGIGGSLGYHFSEYFSLHLLGWKHFSRGSSALSTLEKDTRRTANTNPPSWFAGTEASYSLVYGKLSLLGSSILYYDLHLSGGLGATKTESGTGLTEWAGIGQQLWVSQSAAIRLDYRFMHYRETIMQKDTNQSNFGQKIEDRSNFTNAITLGVSYFFN